MSESLQQAINSLNTRVAAAYTAISEKGGTLPATQNTANLSTAITSIPSGGGSPSDPFVTKEFASFEEAEELEYINVRGALLWVNEELAEGEEGYLLANNGNPDETEEGLTYWDPDETAATPFVAPAKDGYTLIGVCLGNGYWVRIGYDGLSNAYKWADMNDGAYNNCGCYKTGYAMTQDRVNAADYCDETIWHIRDLDTYAGPSDHIVLYIPNQGELIQCCLLACDGGIHESGHSFDNNLGKLCMFSTNNGYWSSSQFPDGSDLAFGVDFYNGYAGDGNKDFESLSVALFHFGA